MKVALALILLFGAVVADLPISSAPGPAHRPYGYMTLAGTDETADSSAALVTQLIPTAHPPCPDYTVFLDIKVLAPPSVTVPPSSLHTPSIVGFRTLPSPGPSSLPPRTSRYMSPAPPSLTVPPISRRPMSSYFEIPRICLLQLLSIVAVAQTVIIAILAAHVFRLSRAGVCTEAPKISAGSTAEATGAKPKKNSRSPSVFFVDRNLSSSLIRARTAEFNREFAMYGTPVKLVYVNKMQRLAMVKYESKEDTLEALKACNADAAKWNARFLGRR